jgi:hypothetical protein
MYGKFMDVWYVWMKFLEHLLGELQAWRIYKEKPKDLGWCLGHNLQLVGGFNPSENYDSQ